MGRGRKKKYPNETPEERKERIRQRQLAYYYSHKEARLEYQNRYAAKRRGITAEAKSQYDGLTDVEIKEIKRLKRQAVQRAYYERNREKILDYSAWYARTHKEQRSKYYDPKYQHEYYLETTKPKRQADAKIYKEEVLTRQLFEILGKLNEMLDSNDADKDKE